MAGSPHTLLRWQLKEQVRFTGRSHHADGKLDSRRVSRTSPLYVHESLKCPDIDSVEAEVLPDGARLKRDAAQPEGSGPAIFGTMDGYILWEEAALHDCILCRAKEGGIDV